jgi:hypothetical protein
MSAAMVEGAIRPQAARSALDRLVDADPGSRADVFARAGGARGAAAPERGLDLLYRSVAIYERLPPGPGHVKALGDIAWILNYKPAALRTRPMW